MVALWWRGEMRFSIFFFPFLNVFHLFPDFFSNENRKLGKNNAQESPDDRIWAQGSGWERGRGGREEQEKEQLQR